MNIKKIAWGTCFAITAGCATEAPLEMNDPSDGRLDRRAEFAFCDETDADGFTDYVSDNPHGVVLNLSENVFRQMAETFRLHGAQADASAIDLFNNSKDGEVLVFQWSVAGEEFTAVEFYPGDNRDGFIFKRDTLETVVSIRDSVFMCGNATPSVQSFCEAFDASYSLPTLSAFLFWIETEGLSEDLTAMRFSRSMADQLVSAALQNDAGTTIESLFERSEGGDLSYYAWSEGNDDFEAVMSWPGGNMYGLVFEAGTANVIAELEDSDLTCL